MLTRPMLFAGTKSARGLRSIARVVPILSPRRTTNYLSGPPASRMNDSVWKLQNIDAAYWDEYIATRPKYDPTIFDPIFAYHAAGKTPFRDALDIGTGAGSTLGPLLDMFGRVTASDNDTVSVQFAQHRFQHIPRSRLSWTMSKGEELIKYHAPASFDMITCALTFPLLDTEKALRCIFTLLRPGGTLAIWFYGPPFFIEPTLATEAQPILYAAMDQAFKPVVSGGNGQQRASWKRAADGMASWLDYIPFSEGQWKDVRRQKWNNTKARLAFFGPAACDFKVEPVSSVNRLEAVTEKYDPTFWNVNWDFEMVRRFVIAVFPKPREMAGPDEIMDGHLKKLREMMGSRDRKASMSWPAVLILARKQC